MWRHRDNGQIPTLPEGLPPIYEKSAAEIWPEKTSDQPSLQRTSVASLASEVDPRTSELDSVVHAGGSSAGTVDRDNINMSDFHDDLIKEGKDDSLTNASHTVMRSGDFKGFPNATEQSLFLDSDSESGSKARSLAEIVRHRRNISKASSNEAPGSSIVYT